MMFHRKPLLLIALLLLNSHICASSLTVEELRIENACKFLNSKEEFSIAEIAFKSGFNNISNFNRKFKEIKKVTPLQYKSL